MLLGSVTIFIFPIFFDFPGNIIIFLLIILSLPLGINAVDQAELESKEKRIKKNKEEIKILVEYIEKEGTDAGIFMRLGYLYKDIEDYENALKNFKKARELTKEIPLPVTEREIGRLEHEVNKEKSKKTRICRHCGAQNYPSRIFCEKCRKILETSFRDYFKGLFKNKFKVTPITIFLTIVFIISAILFGFNFGFFQNFVFYVLILGNMLMFERIIVKEESH